MLKNSIETFCGELTGTILASLNAVHCMCGYKFEKDCVCIFGGRPFVYKLAYQAM